MSLGPGEKFYGQVDAPVPPSKKLSKEERQRVKEKLEQLRDRMMFSTSQDVVHLERVWRIWENVHYCSFIRCADVPWLKSQFDRWGIR